MFKNSSFKKLQTLIEELGRIAADTGTYLTQVYTKSSGSYTRIKWRYNARLFSAEYTNSHKNKRGLHN